jgi:hypothetical protein
MGGVMRVHTASQKNNGGVDDSRADFAKSHVAGEDDAVLVLVLVLCS